MAKRKIRVKKDKFAEQDKFTDEGNVEAAKKIVSRKFKVAKPKSLTEGEGEDSLAEGGEVKLNPPTSEDVKAIKLSKKKRKVKRKK